MITLKKDAMQKIKQAIADMFEEIITAYNQADSNQVVTLVQRGLLLSYEDIVEPSKLNLEDEFWSCFSLDEKQTRQTELIKVLEYMQADKMSAAMDEVAIIKGKCYISDTSARQVFSLIEDYMNNKEEYDA